MRLAQLPTRRELQHRVDDDPCPSVANCATRGSFERVG